MKKIKSFFKGVKKESKMVRWPSSKDMVNHSVIVISMMVFFGLYFYGLDLFFTVVKGIVG